MKAPFTIVLALVFVFTLALGVYRGSGLVEFAVNAQQVEAAAPDVLFTNPAPITIPATGTSGPATPYPSNITVSGLTGTITSVSVRLNTISHTFPDDLDMLLVGPGGQTLNFMSDVGGGTGIVNFTLTFADSGATLPPDAGPLVNGTTYKPSNVGAGDTYTAPAPAGPYGEPAPAGTATFASVYNGLSGSAVNGTWSLYIVDDLGGDVGGISGGWSIDVTTTGGGTPATAGQIIISEFRVRGPSGANDEFIEIYNASGAAHTVTALSGTGYGVAASDGTTRCSIPNGTVIPNRGHYLCVNSVAYSLASYPAGNGTTATGDATYTTDIPDNAGIAIFNNNTGGGSYILANRLDAVGSSSEANTLYKEGTGYPALTPFSIDYAFYRDTCGKGGSIPTFAACTRFGTPKDSGSNSADFTFVDTNGSSAGAGQRLGTPGPENLSSPPTRRGAWNTLQVDPLDACPPGEGPPNIVRDFTSDPPNNSTFGSIDVRRKVTNFTGAPITRLRFRVIDLTTFPAPSGISDLRPRTSTNIVVTVDNPPCGTGTSNVTVNGTTLEQPPNQPNGGGFNSSMSAGTVTLGTPLANGASTNVRFLIGIQQTGRYKLAISAEALPGGSSGYFHLMDCDNAGGNNCFGPLFNFDADEAADASVFRPSNGTWYTFGSVAGFTSTPFGVSTDMIAPADFDGDNRTDVSVFRPSNGVWYRLNSGNNTFAAVPFGTNGDLPLPGDFDGDRRADISVFRPSNGTWYRLNSMGGAFVATPFGQNGDKPVLGDFDGDTRSDIAVFRPSNGVWYRLNSTGGAFVAVQYGAAGDLPATGDFDGDYRTDISVFRPSTGFWHQLLSSTGSSNSFGWGQSGDRPIPADFDGDGITDVAVWRPSNGTWYLLQSSGGLKIYAFGVNGDMPIPSAFVY